MKLSIEEKKKISDAVNIIYKPAIEHELKDLTETKFKSDDSQYHKLIAKINVNKENY